MNANASLSADTLSATGWSPGERVIFRIAFAFFILILIPLNSEYYRNIFNANWHFTDLQSLYQLLVYSPGFIPGSKLPVSGPGAFSNFTILISVSILAGLVWTAFDRQRKEYNQLYYWLRVLVRYRLALGIIIYGALKLFHLQMPYPTLSDLNTEYGYFLKWKVYYLTNGVAHANYEQSLGLLEIIAGILLLYRKTALIGAGLSAVLLSNIVLVNFAYEIGSQVYSVSLLLLSLLIITYDLPRLYRLLFLEKPAKAAAFRPVFTTNNLWISRLTVHILLFVFVITVLFSAFSANKNSNWPFPKKKGFTYREGLYNVSSFIVNGDSISYSITNPLRWQNVVFEKWNTLSIKSSQSDASNQRFPDQILATGNPSEYEQAGNGGRKFYSYAVDTVHRLLIIHNKNSALENYRFRYGLPDDSTITLSGVSAKPDSLRIVLNRIDKKYLLLEGHRKPVKVY